MILIDWNQIAIGSLMVALNKGNQLTGDLFRHIVLNNLRFYRTKFKEEFGEMVICCDNKHYWRRDYFPNYKANRKKDREVTGYDWLQIFELLNGLRDELKESLPYKVIDVVGAEADDIIAVLVHRPFDADEDKFGVIERGVPMNVIVSSDKDFIQLHGHHVKQYSPMAKRMLKNDDPVNYLREHIIKGDRSDGVPNILSHDDTFISAGRQKPIRKAMIRELKEELNRFEYQDLFQIAKCPKDTWIRNWQRNETLIDFSRIPQQIRKDVLDEYRNVKVGDRSQLLNYFVKHKLTDLMSNIGDY